MVVLELVRAGAAAGQQHGQQQVQEFQRRGKPKIVVLELGSTRTSSKTTKNRFLKAREAQNGGFGTGQGRAGAAAGQPHGAAAGAGFTLRAMIGSAIEKCTPDSREGSIFLIRPVLLS